MKARDQIIEEYYTGVHEVCREEFKPIVEWVAPQSKVLDVGCGVGTLGKLLMDKGCIVYGVDISPTAVERAREKGVKAEVWDVDNGLKFDDNSFDYVILCDVLEHVHKPRFVFEESLRVGRSVIVASPNFAFIKARLELLFLGRFPRAPLFGYQWYDTQHIHLFSYKDFLDLIKELNCIVSNKWFQMPSKVPKFLTNLFPNLFSAVFVFEVKK